MVKTIECIAKFVSGKVDKHRRNISLFVIEKDTYKQLNDIAVKTGNLLKLKDDDTLHTNWFCNLPDIDMDNLDEEDTVFDVTFFLRFCRYRMEPTPEFDYNKQYRLTFEVRYYNMEKHGLSSTMVSAVPV